MTTRLYSLLAVLVFAIMLLFALAFPPPATDKTVNVPFENLTELIAENFESLDGALVTATIYGVKGADVLTDRYVAEQPAEVSLTADYRCHNWRSSVAA